MFKALPGSHLQAGCVYPYLHTAFLQSLLVIIRDLLKGGLGGSSLLWLAASETKGPSFNKPSLQTQGGLLVVSAGNVMWHLPQICWIFPPRFSHPCHLSRSHFPFFNTTHMEAMKAWWARRDGFTARENLQSQTCGVFCFGNAWVNCNAFTADIAMNGPCIMGHHYSEETH